MKLAVLRPRFIGDGVATEDEVTLRTRRAESAAKIVRKLSECVNFPPGGRPKTITWRSREET